MGYDEERVKKLTANLFGFGFASYLYFMRYYCSVFLLFVAFIVVVVVIVCIIFGSWAHTAYVQRGVRWWQIKHSHARNSLA